MSQEAAYRPGSVLADSWSNSLLRDAIAIVGYAAFIGLTAQISIPLPFTPVPITGQTFGVLAGALALGSRRSLLGVALYLAAGLAGLPWFAQAHGGLGTLHLPTIGYLIGFLPAAFIAGRLAEAGFYRSPWGAFAAMVACSAVVYVLGVSGLMLTLGVSLRVALTLGVLPFLFGDAVKAVLAAGLLSGSYRVLQGRR